jgi:hypothetical protein
MDPNATLVGAIREITSRDPATLTESHAAELVELVDGLDIWLSRGGFRPDAWEDTSDDYPANSTD